MWSILVAPIKKICTGLTRQIAIDGNEWQRTGKFFERSDQPFDHSNTAMLTDRSESWSDFLSLTPLFVVSAPELTTFVAVVFADGFTVAGSWLLFEYSTNCCYAQM